MDRCSLGGEALLLGSGIVLGVAGIGMSRSVSPLDETAVSCYGGSSGDECGEDTEGHEDGSLEMHLE